MAQGALGASPPQPSMEASPPSIMGALQAQHEQSKAQFDQVAKAQRQMGLLRKGLDSVTKLGPSVTADDVVEEMGKLVAGGLAPEGLIALMAGNPEAQPPSPPMPEGGPQLQVWLQTLEAGLAPQEAAVEQAHGLAAHRYGVTGLQGLMIHHIEQTKAAAQPPSNPLASAS